MATLVVLASSTALTAALGPVGYALAGAAASYIDSRFVLPMLFPADPVKGPRVGEIGIQGADEGAPMNIVYGSGSVRVPCTMIWKSPIIRESIDHGGHGSNSPESSEELVFWHFNIAVCARETASITHLLADTKTFYREDNGLTITASDLTVSTSFERVPRRGGFDALVDDASVSIGDTTVHMDSLDKRPGTDTYDDNVYWILGEVFIVSGQEYHVVSVSGYDGFDADVTFFPPAQAAWADNTAVEFTGYAADKQIQTITSPDPTGTLLDIFNGGYPITISGFTVPGNNGTFYLDAIVSAHELRIQNDIAQPEAAGALVTLSQALPPFFTDVVSDITIYDGNDTQLPDPLVESYEGAGTVPSYRGNTHVILEHFAGKPFGNRPPNFEACVRARVSETVGEVIEDLCIRAKIDPELVDGSLVTTECHGFYVSGAQPAGQVIQTLMLIYDLVAQDREGVLTFLPRADVEVVTIRDDDLGAYAPDESPADPVKVQDATDDELDKQVNLGYQRYNFAGGQTFKPTHGEAVAKRAIHSTNGITHIDAPVVLTAAEARAAAERILWTGHANRHMIPVELPPSYLALRSSDMVQFAAHGDDWSVLLLTAEIGENFRVHCEGAAEVPSTLTASGDSDGGDADDDDQDAPPGVILRMCDVAPLKGEHEKVLGWYAAVASGDPNADWHGCGIYISRDGGDTYSLLVNMPVELTVGYATTKLGNALVGVQDLFNTVDVQLYEGTLSSKTFLEVCNGANWILIGNEVVGFLSASLVGTRKYRLSRFLRGMRGTERQTNQHHVNDQVMLLSGMNLAFVPINLSEVGADVLLKAVPSGGSITDYPTIAFTPQGNTMRCFAPAWVSASRNTSGDITLTWVHVTRGLVSILSPAGAPELEPEQEFEIDVRNGSGVIVGTVSVIGAVTTTILAATQTGWGLTAGAAIDLEIFQVSQTLGSRGIGNRQTL
jgi:Putative phage tail protein